MLKSPVCYEFRELGPPHKVNACGLNHLAPRCIQKDHLLCMVRHGTLSTQVCLVVCNGCIDKLLANIVIVPGAVTHQTGLVQ